MRQVESGRGLRPCLGDGAVTLRQDPLAGIGPTVRAGVPASRPEEPEVPPPAAGSRARQVVPALICLGLYLALRHRALRRGLLG